MKWLSLTGFSLFPQCILDLRIMSVSEIIKSVLIHNITRENRIKTFQNWSKARLPGVPKKTLTVSFHVS